MVTLTDTFGAQSERPGLRSHDDLGPLRHRMAVLLAVLVGVSPVFWGANRPIFWLAASTAVAISAAFYFAVVALRPGARVNYRHYRGVFWLIAAVIGWAAVQLLPIASGGAGHWPGWMRPGQISIAPLQSALGIMRIAGYLLLFVMICECGRNPKRGSALIRWLFLAVAVQALWGLVALNLLGDVLPFREKTAYLGYATGGFINRNSFASYVGMGAIIGVCRIVFRLSDSNQNRAPARIDAQIVLWAIGVAVIWVALLASGSRAGVICTGAGTVVALALAPGWAGAGWPRRAALVLGLGSLVGIAALAILGQSLLDRIVFAHSDFALRRELYAQSIEALRLRPWTGFGLDSFAALFEHVHRAPLSAATIWDKPHNSYLTLFIELGVIAGLLPLLACAAVARNALIAARQGAGTAWVAAAFCAVTVQLGLHAMVDFSLEIPAVTYAFVMLAAVAYCARQPEQ